MLKYILLILCVVPIHLANAKDKGIEKTKTFEEQFVVDKNVRYHLDINDAVVRIITTDKPEISYKCTVKVRAAEEADAEALLSNISPNIEATPANVDMVWRLCASRLEIKNDKKKIKFENGPWIKFQDFSIELEVYVPRTARFDIRSSYSTFNVDDMASDATLKMQDCHYYGGNVQGIASLTFTYSEVELGTVANAECFKLYESDFRATAINKVALFKSTYSHVTISRVGSTEMQSYEDKLYIDELGDVTGKMTYSKLQAKTIGAWNLSTYESDITATSAKSLMGASHYSSFTLESCGAVKFESLYEDRMTISKIDSFEGKGHYGKFEFGNISNFIDYHGFEDKLQVTQLGKSIQRVSVDGKYMNVSLGVAPGLVYSVDLDLQYPNVELPPGDFASQDLTRSTVKTYMRNKAGDGIVFKFKMYEGKLRILKTGA